MELLSIAIFVSMVITFLVYAKGLQENKDIHKDDNAFKHKLLNQNTTIIFFLFAILALLCFIPLALNF